MGKCETCIHSRKNNGGMWCKHSPVRNIPPGDCNRNYNRYESIYTIEPTIVLATRFYALPTNDEMRETEPITFEMGEE